MSTEGDSAKSALSDAYEKSGTDNHTDTSQDSADVHVKDKDEPENEENATTDAPLEGKEAGNETKSKMETEEEDEESGAESEVSEKKDEPDPLKKEEKPEENDVKEEKEVEETKKEENNVEKKEEVKDKEKNDEASDKEAEEDEEQGDEEEEEEEEDEVEEDEENDDDVGKKKKKSKKGGVPLLDQPLETSGKRERKNVQRFTEGSESKEPAKIDPDQGSGTALGDIPRIDASISRFTNDDLKLLYRILFKTTGKSTLIKKHIRKFNGFSFEKDSDEYKKKVSVVQKFDVKHLKSVCEMLDLVKTGSKDDLVGRIIDFLIEPKDSGKPVPGGRPKRASAVRANNRGYSSHDDFSSDEKHSSRARRDKGKRTNLKDDSSSDEEFQPDGSDASDDKPKVLNTRKRGRQKKKDSSDEDEASLTDESEDSDEPKNKRRKSVKANNKPKSRTPAKGRGRGRPKAPVTPRRGRKSKRKETSDEEDESDQKMDDGSSSEDEPLVKKKTKSSEPPTDDEIKTFIKSILEGANLEEITMKTVCQRVYANYPDFDLSHKKDFIKTTVKSLIST